MKKLTPTLLPLICIVFAITVRTQTPEQARNFQIDATHSGAITSDHLTPPLKQRWVANFGRSISYPLIADGRVYVTVKDAVGNATSLYALNAANGATLWSAPLGGSFPWSASCYENGRVFALNGSGLLRAFDGATGNMLWSNNLVGFSTIFDAPPTVYQGVVYVSGSLKVFAVNANTGAVIWTKSVVNGDTSSPALTSDGLYVSYSCPNVYKLDPVTGNQIWFYTQGCSGGGGKTPALYNGRLYVRDFSDTIFDSATGTIIGNFNAKNTPAFSNGRGFFLNGPHSFGTFGTLQARDVNTNTVLWSFAGDGFLQSAVLVVNGYVYVGSSQGKLYALDATTGQQVWVTTAGTSIPYVDEQNVSQPLTSFAAAEGLLVVPTSTTLVAYEGDTTPPTLTWGNLTPAANAAGWNNSAVDFSFTTADDLSGVQSVNPASPLHFVAEGANQTQQVTVTDKAGNSATFTSPPVNIDLTIPSTTALLDGTSSGGWYKTPVTVTLSAVDMLSGVGNRFYRIDGGAVQTYGAPFVVSTAGQHTIDYWSVDVAGNAEPAHSLALKIDNVGPVVTASASPATASKSPRPVTITVSGSATDSLSGLANASFNVIDEYGVTQPSGSVTVQANGSYSFTLTLPATRNGPDKNGHLYTIVVSALDQVGNSGSATTTLRIN